jgi:peptidoglycan/xylan/chitin deacetylase (PgdA/CDA1 family)
VTIVTTSWDDGDVKDLRLADLLYNYGVKATFYIPLQCDGISLMNPGQVRSLRSAGFEIGSHGLTHTPLTSSPAPERELSESRTRLQDMLGEPILAFCYPLGQFNRQTAVLAEKAGYRMARTTVGFRMNGTFDRFQTPVSLQFYPHSRRVLLKHELKGKNLIGLGSWVGKWAMRTDLDKLASAMLDGIGEGPGVFHVWGHSWEVDRYGLWKELEDLLRLISHRPGVSYRTNLELLAQ